MANPPLDVIFELTGTILDEFTIYASGSTPLSVAELVESTIDSLPVLAVGRYTSLMIIAAVGQRRIIDEYLMRPANTDLLAFVKTKIYIGQKVNFSNLNLAGHCILAAAGHTEVGIIAAFRQKLGADNIWNANYNRSTISEAQKNIFKEKIEKFTLQEAVHSGVRILNALMNRAQGNLRPVNAADVPPPPPPQPRTGADAPEFIPFVVPNPYDQPGSSRSQFRYFNPMQRGLTIASQVQSVMPSRPINAPGTASAPLMSTSTIPARATPVNPAAPVTNPVINIIQNEDAAGGNTQGNTVNPTEAVENIPDRTDTVDPNATTAADPNQATTPNRRPPRTGVASGSGKRKATVARGGRKKKATGAEQVRRSSRRLSGKEAAVEEHNEEAEAEVDDEPAAEEDNE